jgi:hypothetical protein
MNLTRATAKAIGGRAAWLLQFHRDRIDPEDIETLEDLRRAPYDALRANRWFEDELERLEAKHRDWREECRRILAIMDRWGNALERVGLDFDDPEAEHPTVIVCDRQKFDAWAS